MTQGRSSTPADGWPCPIAICLPGVASFSFMSAELEPILGDLALDLEQAARRMRRSLRAARPPRPPAPAFPPDPPGDLSIEELVTLVCDMGRNRDHPGSNALPSAADSIRVARWASGAGARLTAVAFAQIAYEADQLGAVPDLAYAFELAAFALQVPSLAPDGSDWLTWVALQARGTGRWELYLRSLSALADTAAASLNLVNAPLLRRLAALAELAARHDPPSRSSPPDPE